MLELNIFTFVAAPLIFDFHNYRQSFAFRPT